MEKQKAFGGFVVNFQFCEESLEQVFGTENITPSEMTKKLWKYIKSKNLDFSTKYWNGKSE